MSLKNQQSSSNFAIYSKKKTKFSSFGRAVYINTFIQMNRKKMISLKVMKPD